MLNFLLLNDVYQETNQRKHIGTNSGHEKWARSDLRRPVIFQTHIDPLPEFIIKNNLRVLNISKSEFFEILEGDIEIKKTDGKYIIEDKKDSNE